MVNVGFICEGATEKIILDSQNFRILLKKCKLNLIGEVNDAGGNMNLLPNNIEKIKNNFLKIGAEKIIILTDSDNDTCIALTRNRIGLSDNQIVIVAVKQIEAWFLADTITINKMIKTDFKFEFPEEALSPFNKIKEIFQKYTNRGIGTKRLFSKRIINKGFSIENAANHPNCNSAKYFLQKLQELNSQK